MTLVDAQKPSWSGGSDKIKLTGKKKRSTANGTSKFTNAKEIEKATAKLWGMESQDGNQDYVDESSLLTDEDVTSKPSVQPNPGDCGMSSDFVLNICV